MEKAGKVLVISILGVFLLASNAMSLGFSSTGIVDPNYNNSWNESTLSGTAFFQFTIDEDWPSVNYVQLEFENDIFNLSGTQSSDFNVLNPGGWTTSLQDATNGYRFSISSAGTPATSLNNPIHIAFNYVLLSADRFSISSEGTPDGWAWDEGQPWAISYTLANKETFDLSSGSTAPVPEPATLFMLGSGLIGLAAMGRKKIFKPAESGS